MKRVDAILCADVHIREDQPICACGCGLPVTKSKTHPRGVWNKFVKGHNNRNAEFSKEHRLNLSKSATGRILSEETKSKISKTVSELDTLGNQKSNNNFNWKGGRRVDRGYIEINISCKSYKFEHRIIMEKHLGRKLLSTELVHHKDGNRSNNEIDNLQIMTRKDHTQLHWSERKRNAS